MTIIDCYAMDLYCRKCPTEYGGWPDPLHSFNEFPHQYNGATRSACVRAARKRGWTFQRDGDATCPKCSRAAARKGG